MHLRFVESLADVEEQRAVVVPRHDDGALDVSELIIGESRAISQVMHVVRQVAPTDTTVLIQGETGTGKELITRALHSLSLRRDNPLIAVNCAALPEGMIESELFGHERGAFTGASQRRIGRFERARGGTLFLDEVGDLQPAIQVKLLRVLQEGTFERLGGEVTMAADVRIVAATLCDLGDLVEQGRFREDLYYRLAVIPLQLPPLRDRPEDIWPLAQHYLNVLQARMGKDRVLISEHMREALLAHDWPGNVRELINVIERAVALTPSGERVDTGDVGVYVPRRPDRGWRANGRSLKEMVRDFERKIISTALTGADGSRTKAARQLGLSRQALSTKLARYKL